MRLERINLNILKEREELLFNINPLFALWNEISYYFDKLDYKKLSEKGLNGLGFITWILTNPNDNLWNLATDIANGKNEYTIKTAVKDAQTKFMINAGVKAGSGLLSALNIISLSNPISAIVVTAVNLFSQLANFGSITARQRSSDAEQHLDNYRKLVPNLSISDYSKSILHNQIQKLRAIRPKCKSLTKDCEKEHIRYWIIGQMFRETIDYYNKVKIEIFTDFNDKFVELLQNEGFNIEKYINDFMKERERVLKKKNQEIKGMNEISQSEIVETTKKPKGLLNFIFSFIDEILSIFLK